MVSISFFKRVSCNTQVASSHLIRGNFCFINNTFLQAFSIQRAVFMASTTIATCILIIIAGFIFLRMFILCPDIRVFKFGMQEYDILTVDLLKYFLSSVFSKCLSIISTVQRNWNLHPSNPNPDMTGLKDAYKSGGDNYLGKTGQI